MQKPILIGLTGQSGAGKSTVSGIMRELGLAVIDCDGISRLVSTYPEFLSEVEKAFPGYTDENGLKRREFGALVFNDHEKLGRYGQIIFPLIKKELAAQIERLASQGERIVVLDAPTLFESGLDKACAEIISVIAPLDMKIKRILERDGIPVELAQSRLSSQYAEKFLYDRSDRVIVNDGDISDLRKKTEELVLEIKERFDA